jgi:hypothetical protein
VKLKGISIKTFENGEVLQCTFKIKPEKGIWHKKVIISFNPSTGNLEEITVDDLSESSQRILRNVIEKLADIFTLIIEKAEKKNTELAKNLKNKRMEFLFIESKNFIVMKDMVKSNMRAVI